jgi:ABC-type antimicrobial peptide transport system permease subunit
MEYILYNLDPITPTQFTDFHALCNASISQPFGFHIADFHIDNFQEDYPYFKYIFRFLKIYTILVIIFTLLGVGLNWFLNYSKKNIQLALLRSHGYRKQDLIKLNLQENGIFVLFGVIFSLISFFGTGLYIIIINVSTFGLQFPLYLRINYGVYFLTLVLGGILFMGVNILLSLRSIKQTDTKKDLEKILRYRY